MRYSTFNNLIEISWFVGKFKTGIFEIYLLLLYKSWVFVTEDNYNIKFYIFYNQFRHYTAAKKFIDEKLMLNKEKTVWFFTTHIFTPRSYK